MTSVPSQNPPSSDDYTLEAYTYHLPPEQIAQTPAVPRDSARLLVVTSPTQHQHATVQTLPQWLRSGDLLVLNDTRVIPARLIGQKPGGAVAEVLLLEKQAPLQWLALVKPGRRLKPGTQILFGADLQQPELIAHIDSTDASTGGRVIRFEVPSGDPFETVLQRLGQVPLPPYITQTEALPEQYQTVYATQPGAIAAPTAGLHFTPELLDRLTQAGIEQRFITLHVGVGTFRPVEATDITQHAMHAEWIDVSPETVAAIAATKARGGRVIAVGTTVTRALEGAAQSGQLQPQQGKTNLFIYPGYEWQVIDGLMTNFHLPESSLLMLVSALIGRQRLMDLYAEAVNQGYRFYSFGDAMLILPEAKS